MEKSGTIQITEKEMRTENTGCIPSLEHGSSVGNAVEIVPITEDEVSELLAQINISHIDTLLEVYKVRRAYGYSLIYDSNCLVYDSIDSIVGLSNSFRRFSVSFLSDLFHVPL
jgi:hypothetical protein